MKPEKRIQNLENAARKLSYYHAAEGPQWQKERGSRQAAIAEFKAAKAECDKAGDEYDLSQFLVF